MEEKAELFPPILSIWGIQFSPCLYICPSPAHLWFPLSNLKFPDPIHLKKIIKWPWTIKARPSLNLEWYPCLFYWKLSYGPMTYGHIHFIFFNCSSEIYQTNSNNIILLINLKKCI